MNDSSKPRSDGLKATSPWAVAWLAVLAVATSATVAGPLHSAGQTESHGPVAQAAAPGHFEPDAARPIAPEIEAQLLADMRSKAPTTLYEIVDVVDGDTVHILKDGKKAKLRLLCVDTEEKLSNRSNVDPSKPETVFGQATADWAKAYFPARAMVDGKPRIGLVYPDGVERLDVYGRLLCQVVLPDGLDFNVLLVRLGKSPYFNKYGSSECCDQAFQAAQAQAREEQLGIWNPTTNRAAAATAPSAVRPYDELIPWWNARAAAVDRFRAERALNAIRTVAADEPEALELSVMACEAGARVRVFGSIDRIFEETNGDRTLLLRTGARDQAVRAVIPAARLQSFDLEDLEYRAGDRHTQNYLFFEGPLERRGNSYRLELREAGQIELGGPDPKPASEGSTERMHD